MVKFEGGLGHDVFDILPPNLHMFILNIKCDIFYRMEEDLSGFRSSAVVDLMHICVNKSDSNSD